MSWLKKVKKATASEVLESGAKLADSLVTTEKDKITGKKEIAIVAQDAQLQAMKVQSDIIRAEMNGNNLQRSWRPISGLTLLFIVFSAYFLFPVINLFLQDDNLHELIIQMKSDDRFWNAFKILIGGLVGSRGVEKVSAIITKNIDLPFLRKKDRKGQIEK